MDYLAFWMRWKSQYLGAVTVSLLDNSTECRRGQSTKAKAKSSGEHAISYWSAHRMAIQYSRHPTTYLEASDALAWDLTYCKKWRKCSQTLSAEDWISFEKLHGLLPSETNLSDLILLNSWTSKKAQHQLPKLLRLLHRRQMARLFNLNELRPIDFTSNLLEMCQVDGSILLTTRD